MKRNYVSYRNKKCFLQYNLLSYLNSFPNKFQQNIVGSLVQSSIQYSDNDNRFTITYNVACLWMN